MAEYIGLLKTASFFVAVLGFLLLCLSAFIVWKYDLLDYYRFKTGKGKKKASDVEKPKTISQYYSETLNDDHSHEIINQEYEQDSSDLADNITIGRNNSGEIQQVIDNDVVDFSFKSKSPSIPLPEGSEETTLLGQTEHSQKLHVPSDFDNEKVFESSIVEEVYENDNGIDETDVIPLPKPNFNEIYEADENIDETDVINILKPDENEGDEETQLLSENLDETDAIHIEPSTADLKEEDDDNRELDLHIKNKEAFLGRKLTAAEVALAKLELLSSTASAKSEEDVKNLPKEDSKETLSHLDSDETELLQPKNKESVQEGFDGSDETELLQREVGASVQEESDGSDETELLNKPVQDDDATEDLSKEQGDSVQDNEATTLLVDEDGEAETTILSQSNNEEKLSSSLWAKQTTKFEISKNSNLLVTAVKN